MERRTPFLAGVVSLVGARRIKPQNDHYTLFGLDDPDNVSHGHDSSVHPACAANWIPDRKECPCKEFYDALMKVCNDNIEKYSKRSSNADRNCSDIVYNMWNNKDMNGDLVYKLFLAPNTPSEISSIPVFWAGFSWRLGTRQTMDEILQNASAGPVIFRDIEHNDTRIGQVLRSLNWDRACHASTHDSTLWVALSQTFGNGTKQAEEKQIEAAKSRRNWARAGGIALGVVAVPVGAALGITAASIGLAPIGFAALQVAGLAGVTIGETSLAVTSLILGSTFGMTGGGASAGAYAGNKVGNMIVEKSEAAMLRVVRIVVNYPVDKLEKTFLVKHELNHLHPFGNIMVMDFKNHCSPSLIQMILEGVRKHDQESHPIISCISENELAFHHDRTQFFSLGDYEKRVNRLDVVDRSRQMKLLGIMQDDTSFMKAAGSVISKLEACYTHGIVWRTPLQPMSTSEMAGTDKDDIKKCQQRCNEAGHCSHFNLFTSNRSCELLNRTEALYYEIAGEDVISGRVDKKGTCAEDEELAASERKNRKEKIKKDLKAYMERTVDVTSLVETPAFETSGMRCCCDKAKVGSNGDKGVNELWRANYCAIFAAQKCGGVKVRTDTKKAHNYRKTGGKCEILPENFPVLVKAVSTSANNYCPKNDYLFMGMKVDIPPAAIGETRNAPCLDGSLGTVTCQVGTPTIGYWGPVQCGGKPAWCPAIPNIDESAPRVAAAKLDDEMEVLCEPGESSTVNTRCSEEGWIPENGVGWKKDGFPPVCFSTSAAPLVRTVDVTSLVNTEAFQSSGERCCCDKLKVGSNRDKGVNERLRANYCAIVSAQKCGDVKVRKDTKKAHNYLSTGGKCEILLENIPVLVKVLSTSTKDYCPKNDYLFMGMEVDIPPAALGETRNAPCLDGSPGIVTCQVGTPTIGYWGPVQCSGKPAWCPAIPRLRPMIDDSAPEVAAARLGDEMVVLCGPGESSTVNTICSEKGWIPENGTGWNKDGVPPVCLSTRLKLS